MATAREAPTSPQPVDVHPDIPADDGESFGVWAHTTMFDGVDAEEPADPGFLRGID